MSAAIEIDSRAVTVNEVSVYLRKAMTDCEHGDYRSAIRHLCSEIERLSAEINELKEELYGE